MGRAELLSCICTLLSVLAWLGPTRPIELRGGSSGDGGGRRGSEAGTTAGDGDDGPAGLRRAGACLALGACGMMCKEQGALAPLVPPAAAALRWVVRARQPRRQAASTTSSTALSTAAAASTTSGVAAAHGCLVGGALALVALRVRLFGGTLPAFSSVRQNPLLGLPWGGPRELGTLFAAASHLALLAWPWTAPCHDWSALLLPQRLAHAAAHHERAEHAAATAGISLPLSAASAAWAGGEGGAGGGAAGVWLTASQLGFTGAALALSLAAIAWLLLGGSSARAGAVVPGKHGYGSGSGAAAAAAAAEAADELRTVCFGVALLAVPLLPAAHVLVDVGFLVAERALFTPSAGACLLAAAAGARLLGNLGVGGRGLGQDGARQQRDGRGIDAGGIGIGKVSGGKGGGGKGTGSALKALPSALAAVALCAIVGGMAARSAARGQDWASEAALYASGLAALPASPALHYSAGQLALRSTARDLPAARASFAAALALCPSYFEASTSLSQVRACFPPRVWRRPPRDSPHSIRAGAAQTP